MEPVALFRGRDFISTSTSPGKTGLRAKDSEKDSLGRYCENSTECGIFDANLMLIENIPNFWCIRGDAIII